MQQIGSEPIITTAAGSGRTLRVEHLVEPNPAKQIESKSQLKGMRDLGGVPQIAVTRPLPLSLFAQMMACKAVFQLLKR